MIYVGIILYVGCKYNAAWGRVAKLIIVVKLLYLGENTPSGGD